ncbi:MFS transporter [Novosphingobium sp. B 225]|uniref:MFS transporter n=1 Tax=Novosphingobium sp. B 225 TaxID=1961849 RepID=UPI000B4BD16D|nr:MFS transporter [Novosphingobium sp. B 225]
MAEPSVGGSRAPRAFLIAYALAWCGGAIAYVPFLTILLPVRVELLAGAQHSITWLAYLAFAGAIAASLGHIGFGYLSDITRVRRPWIGAGLILSSLLLVLVGKAGSLAGLLTVIILWQLALNMMLAPLAAWAGDCVPDAQKGLLGGLLAFAPALGALSGAAVTWSDLATADIRLGAIAVLVCLCVAPVLLMRGGSQPAGIAAADGKSADGGKWFLANPLVRRMWLARLAVQIAEAALFAYLYLWFRSIDPAMGDHRTARVFSTVLLLSAPLALMIGHWADRHAKPIWPLAIAAMVSSLGLVTMALASDLFWAIGTYALFGLASSVFLALHSAQTLRVLPRPDRRGRDLGLFNLTNTVPSLVMPWLVLAMVPQFGFAGVFVLLAALALSAGLVLIRLPSHI